MLGHLLHSSILVPYHGWYVPCSQSELRKLIRFQGSRRIVISVKFGCLIIFGVILLKSSGGSVTGLITRTMGISRMTSPGTLLVSCSYMSFRLVGAFVQHLIYDGFLSYWITCSCQRSYIEVWILPLGFCVSHCLSQCLHSPCTW